MSYQVNLPGASPHLLPYPMNAWKSPETSRVIRQNKSKEEDRDGDRGYWCEIHGKWR